MRSINTRRLYSLLRDIKLPAPSRVDETYRVPLLDSSHSGMDYTKGATNSIGETVDVVIFIAVIKKSSLRPDGWLDWELLMQ